MPTATELFLNLVAAKGSDARVRRVDSTIPCPCRTPEGFRDPFWHEQATPAALRALTLGYEKLVEAHTPVTYWRLDSNPPLVGEIAGKTLIPYGTIQFEQPPVLTAQGNSITIPGGSGNYLECVTSDFVFDGRRPFTVELWVNAHAIVDSMIASYRWSSGNKVSGWSIEILNGGLEFVRQHRGARKSARMESMQADTPYYIVARYDGTEMRLYVDNVLVDTESPVDQSLEPPSDYETVSLRISDVSATSFSGSVDEIAIYNRSLSEAQFNYHWMSGKAESGSLTGNFTYSYTLVDAKGERPHLSPPSEIVHPSLQRVWLQLPPFSPEIKSARIYRQRDNEPYLYAGEITAPETIYMDNTPDGGLQQIDPPNYVCNEAGFLPDPANTIDMMVKAFVQPALSTRRHMPREQFEILFAGAVQEDDHLGIFPCTWLGTMLNFDDWSRSGEDFIEYRGRRFVVVGASMIPDPTNGAPDHHWELALRLTDRQQFGVA